MILSIIHRFICVLCVSVDVSVYERVWARARAFIERPLRTSTYLCFKWYAYKFSAIGVLLLLLLLLFSSFNFVLFCLHHVCVDPFNRILWHHVLAELNFVWFWHIDLSVSDLVIVLVYDYTWPFFRCCCTLSLFFTLCLRSILFWNEKQHQNT